MQPDQVEAAIAAIRSEIDDRLPDAFGSAEIRKNIVILATAMTTFAERIKTGERLALVNAKSLLKAADRIDAVAKNPLRYDGPHESGKSYAKGTLVSRGGSMWHCNSPTASTPGDGGPAWTLCVKSGRDGRDAAR